MWKLLRQYLQRQTLISKYKQTGDKKYLREYYEREKYKNLHNRKPSPKQIMKIKLLMEMMALKPGERVLDVGCANKMLKPYIETKKAIYIGLDIAETFEPDIVADAEDMSVIGDDEYDWVAFVDVLEHLPNPEKAVKEAFRVGRRVIAVVPNLYHLESIPYLPRYYNDRHLVRMSPFKWLEMFKSAGFSISVARGFYYVPSIAFFPFPLLTGIDKVMDKVFNYPPLSYIATFCERRLSERFPFKYLGQELIIVGNRKTFVRQKCCL